MEATIAGAFALLIGGVGLWTGISLLRKRAVLDGWHTTTGRVIERGTVRATTGTSPPAFGHAALVKYVYQVGGREFAGDCIRPKQIQLPEHSTQKWARERAASFPDEVTVHYNPENPAECFLVQTTKRTLYVVILASCLIILFGVMRLLA
ncbi:MAG TPA: DUF3592 domain-containing protein [Pyrinomonadaceae bacterium]|jgi:hypothetical protein